VFNGHRPFSNEHTSPAKVSTNGAPGPGAYDCTADKVSPRAKGFAFTSRPAKGIFDHVNGVPGPGTYTIKENHQDGTTFYKGSFATPRPPDVPGPGHYTITSEGSSRATHFGSPRNVSPRRTQST
jgi:hypothetical protein